MLPTTEFVRVLRVEIAARWLYSAAILISLALAEAVGGQIQTGQPPAPAPTPRPAEGGLPTTRRDSAGRPPVAVSGSREADHAKAIAHQQFIKNFRELQELGYGLLREHEAGRLKPAQLSKDAKSIHKRAKNLRSLLELGRQPLPPPELIGLPATPQEFDRSIHRLARTIYTFAHNPVHQSNKVLNTREAAQARVDLANIIGLSQTIHRKAQNYVALLAHAN